MSPMLEAVADNMTTVRLANNFWSRARQFNEPWHNAIRRWRRYYDFAHYGNQARPNEDRYADPTYTNVVDLAVGIVLANDIEWRAYGFSPSPEEDEDTSHIEKYLAGLWEINDVREGSYQKFDLIQNFMRDGCGIIYSVWDEEIAKRVMDIKPQQDPSSPEGVTLVPVYTESPVRVQVIDPLKVFALPGGPYRWLQVGKIERVSVYDAESIYGKRFPKWGYLTMEQRSQQYGNLIDYWRLAEIDVPVIERNAIPPQDTAMGGPMMGNQMPMPGMGQNEGMMPMPGQFATPATPPEPAQTRKKYVVQHSLVFEDQVIWPLHNTGYDDLPFSIGFFKPVSKDAPKDWGHNIMRPLETTIELLEKLTNRRTRQINTFTSLPMTLQAIAGRPPVQIQGLDMDVLELSQGEEIKFPQWPGSPPDVDRQIDFMLRRAQQSGFSDVAFGSGPSQVAGYALSQLSDTNRIRLEQPVKHLEFLLSQWAQKALKITAKYAPDAVIRVYGQLRGKDFVDQVFSPDLADYKVKALIKPEFPNEKVRNHAMATQVRGVLSENTIMERYLDIDQPDDEKKRRLRDAAMNHPVMVQYGIINTLMEMAQAGDQAAAMTLQHLLMGQGTGNPEGRPEEPRNNEQMMGVASPTGQPTPEEAGAAPPGQSPEDQMRGITEAAPGMT